MPPVPLGGSDSADRDAPFNSAARFSSANVVKKNTGSSFENKTFYLSFLRPHYPSLFIFFFFPQLQFDLDFRVADCGGFEVPFCKRSQNSSVHGFTGIIQLRNRPVPLKTLKLLNF